jgi:hypothetical protein
MVFVRCAFYASRAACVRGAARGAVAGNLRAGCGDRWNVEARRSGRRHTSRLVMSRLALGKLASEVKRC